MVSFLWLRYRLRELPAGQVINPITHNVRPDSSEPKAGNVNGVFHVDGLCVSLSDGKGSLYFLSLFAVAEHLVLRNRQGQACYNGRQY